MNSVILSGAVDFSTERAETSGELNRVLNNHISTQVFKKLKIRYSPHKVGALMLSISIEHPDAEEFINAKLDLSKVTGANISVQVTDEFMRAVIEDKPFVQKFPVGSTNPIMTKTIQAKELWDTLIHNAWSSAEPGIIFGDTMKTYSPDAIYEKYRMICTNPCHRSTSNVLTKEGLKKVIDVKEGDVVWSSEGWTNVVRKQSSGIKDVYQYRTTGGSFYGTENHKLVSHGVKIEAKDAESIDLLGGFNSNKVVKDDEYLQSVMDGLVLGDGSVHKSSNNLVYLIIGENDTDYFTSEIKDLIVKGRKGVKNTAYDIKTTIKADELPKTFERSIPKRFMYASPNVIKGILRGLYSANGSVVSKRVTYKTTSSKMRDDVMILLSSIGIRSYYTTNNKKYVKFDNGEYECKESYDINISTDRDIFYKNVGFLQEYKMNKLEKYIEDIRKTNKTHDIVETKFINTEEVFDITVDNNTHTLWVDGLNVSNCGEVSLGAYDSCRLIHINFNSFVSKPFTEDAKFNYRLLYEVSYETQRLADDLVDLEIEAIDNIIDICKDDKFEKELWKKMKDTGEKGRRTGVGFTALADAIASLNINYNSKEGIETVEKIVSTWSKALTDSTIDLAIERGSFPDFKGYFNHEHEFKNNVWYESLRKRDEWNYSRLLKFGSRNISWNTVNRAAA